MDANFLQEKSRREKATIIIALLVMIICISLIYSGRFWRSYHSQGIPIGEITALSNDTRFRENQSIAWDDAETQQTVAIGDAVFTGESSTMTVKMYAGDTLNLEEQTLIVFRSIHGIDFPDLQRGSVTVVLNGDSHFSMRGRLGKLSGRNAVIRLTADGNGEPEVRVVRGEAHWLPLEDKAVAGRIPELRPLEDVVHTWRLYDLYDIKSSGILAREKSPEFVLHPLRLTWSADLAAGMATVQLDSSPQFAKPWMFGGQNGEADLNRIYLGENVWRVSLDGKKWSMPGKFNVTGKFRAQAPRLQAYHTEVPWVNGRAAGSLVVGDRGKALGYIIEESADESFSQPVLRRFWSSGKMTIVSYTKPGKYFYRARSVDENQELSVWSMIEQISVYRAARPLSPQLLSLNRTEALVGDEIGFEFSSEANETLVTVVDAKGVEVARFNSTRGIFRPDRAGRFKLSSVAIDENGMHSRPSRPTLLKIRDKIVLAQKPKAPPATAEIPRLLRQPAAQPAEKLRARLPSPLQPPSLGPNDTYKSSFLSLQGFLWTLQSSEQYVNNDEAPVATGGGLRGIYWKNHSGMEGIVKSQVFSVNEAGHRTMLQDIEARYHYRFFTNFPFRLARELQVSFYSGINDFHNKGPNFTNHYTLLTIGNMLEFPVGQSWSMGGEFIFGCGLDDTAKFEITGHFKYYLSRRWSLGYGYLLHFFRSGSDLTAPPGAISYREGYTEGFMTMDYHFE